MTLHHYVTCDGPSCKKRTNVHVNCHHRKGIEVSLPGPWIQDKGWGHWCSTKCRDAWQAKKFPLSAGPP